MALLNSTGRISGAEITEDKSFPLELFNEDPQFAALVTTKNTVIAEIARGTKEASKQIRGAIEETVLTAFADKSTDIAGNIPDMTKGSIEDISELITVMAMLQPFLGLAYNVTLVIESKDRILLRAVYVQTKDNSANLTGLMNEFMAHGIKVNHYRTPSGEEAYNVDILKITPVPGLEQLTMLLISLMTKTGAIGQELSMDAIKGYCEYANIAHAFSKIAKKLSDVDKIGEQLREYQDNPHISSLGQDLHDIVDDISEPVKRFVVAYTKASMTNINGGAE